MVGTKPQNGSTALPLPPSASVISLGSAGKILCLADIRGDFDRLNAYVEETGACAVIHTGDLGFMDGDSPARMAPRILRHVLSYTPLIPATERAAFLALPHSPALFSKLNPSSTSSSSSTSSNPSESFLLSQLGRLLSGSLKLSVPVFCVYGPVEDVVVLEKFRTGEYEVDNLLILDEVCSRLVEVGGLKLRLLGLGGAIMMHKIFDNGDATGTIAGGNGTVWATALQIGELMDTAQRVYDPTETRLLVTHGPMGKDGLLSQLALALKADLTISGSLHFRFIASFNEFAVNGDTESFKQKLVKSKAAFMEVYESARPQLEKLLQSDQQHFLALALEVAQKIPSFDGVGEDDQMWKNCWNWNLSEATFGKLVLNIKDARVSAEMISQGLNFGYRQTKKTGQSSGQPVARPANSGMTTSIAPTQTPPPPGINGLGAQAKPPIRKAVAPIVPAAVIPKSIATSPIGSKFLGNLNQQTRFPAGPIPPPPIPQFRPHIQQSNALPVTPPSAAAAPPPAPAVAPAPPVVRPKAIPALPSKPPGPGSERQQPAQRQVNGSGPAQAPINRPEPRNAKPSTAPAAPAAVPASTPAPTQPQPATSSTEKDAQPESTGKKGRKEREPRQREHKQNVAGTQHSGGSQQPPKPKENGVPAAQPGTKAEPVETTGPDPVGQGKADNEEASGSSKPVVKAPPTGPAAGVRPQHVRNPHTLYAKHLPPDITEEELRGFWAESERSKITRVNIPHTVNRSNRFAYIEFGNDEDLQAALAKHGSEIKGSTPIISISAPPAGPGGMRGGRGGANGGPGGFRGGGPGRGGGGGGRGGGQSRGGGPKAASRAGGNGGPPSNGEAAELGTSAPAPAPSGGEMKETW